MKKLISIILSLVMLVSVCTFAVYAAPEDVTIIGISQIGKLEVLESGAYYWFSGDISVAGVMGKEGFEFLYNIFTDENLICVDSNITEMVTSAHPNYPTDGMEFGFFAQGEISYSVTCEFKFNKDIVLVSLLEGELNNKSAKQGFFKFKDSSVYDEIVARYEEWSVEQRRINKENEEARKKNKVNITDFEWIYRAEYGGNYLGNAADWGICTYKREGEDKPVVAMAYVIAWFDEWKSVVVSEKMPENNAFTVPALRVVDVFPGGTSGEEYETEFTISGYSYHVNVNEDMSVQSVSHSIDEFNYTLFFDMSKYKEFGKIPAGYFSPENSSEYKNKVTNFEILYTEKGEYKNNTTVPGRLEWGICRYFTEESGEVYAFYKYEYFDDIYRISEIDKVYSDKPIKADFSSGRTLVNGYEIFNYLSTPYYALQIMVNDKKEISSRLFYYAENRSSDITNLEVVSGNLDSLDVIATEIKTENPPEEDEKKDETVKTDETEKKDDTAVDDKKEDTAADDKKEDDTKEDDKKEDGNKEEVKTDEKDEKDENKPEDETKINLDYAFIDVPQSHWAYNQIHDFAEKEIVLGYGNGYFGVNDSITYEHFALLLERLFAYGADNTERVPAVREDVIVSVAKALNLDTSNADVSVIGEKFSDCGDIKEENKKYIAAAIETGLVIGSDGKLHPEDNLTRAETVVLLSRAVNY